MCKKAKFVDLGQYWYDTKQSELYKGVTAGAHIRTFQTQTSSFTVISER